MSEQYNAELIEMLQKAICLERDHWDDDAYMLLKSILGDDWQNKFYERWFGEEDLRKELDDE